MIHEQEGDRLEDQIHSTSRHREIVGIFSHSSDEELLDCRSLSPSYFI
ncbi:MAG: hypothetical protein AB4426_27925 [Xenococcaceae cyanobacterium]